MTFAVLAVVVFVFGDFQYFRLIFIDSIIFHFFPKMLFFILLANLPAGFSWFYVLVLPLLLRIPAVMTVNSKYTRLYFLTQIFEKTKTQGEKNSELKVKTQQIGRRFKKILQRLTI